jgi:hypothetical protein
VCESVQAVGAALPAAPLAVDNLVDAGVQLGFPCIDRDVDIFAVEDVVNRVGAA